MPKKTPRDQSLPVEALRFPLLDPAEEGARLDHFLGARLSWRSRTSIVDLLDAGKVRRNGEVVTKKALRLRTGDVVEVEVPPPDEEVRHEALAEDLEAAVLHDDEDLLAVAKPAGLVVHPVGRVRANTLIQALHWMFRHGARRAQRGRDPGGAVIPRICHRLDKDTSGVLVVAKHLTARSRLQHIFEGHEASKEYLSVVSGVVAAERGAIDLPMGPDPDAPVDLMMTTRPDGVPAHTEYEVVERFAAATFVRFRIRTGRQHQIRVHARAIGHPVLLDALYGVGPTAWPSDDAPLIARQALHAWRLSFPHPRTGERLGLEAPLPDDMAALLARLRGM